MAQSFDEAGDADGAPHARPFFVPWLALWAGAVGLGLVVLLGYGASPGTRASAPLAWPDDSELARGEGPTLLVFVHPHCSCSRATVVELGHLLARVGDRVTARLVLVRPRNVPPGWERTELRALASSIPGLALIDDEDATEATRFGALTSGTTLLYDAHGALAFVGGITASRGHEGNSFGQERVVALLTAGTSDRDDSPVFGCALARGPEGARQ